MGLQMFVVSKYFESQDPEAATGLRAGAHYSCSSWVCSADAALPRLSERPQNSSRRCILNPGSGTDVGPKWALLRVDSVKSIGKEKF